MPKKKKVIAKTAKSKSAVKEYMEPEISKVITKIIIQDSTLAPKSINNTCAEIYADIQQNHIQIPHRSIIEIDCGFSIEIQSGYRLVVKLNNFLTLKGLIIPNSPHVVTEGRVKIIVCNIGREIIPINHGDSIGVITAEPIYDLDLHVSGTE